MAKMHNYTLIFRFVCVLIKANIETQDDVSSNMRSAPPTEITMNGGSKRTESNFDKKQPSMPLPLPPHVVRTEVKRSIVTSRIELPGGTQGVAPHTQRYVGVKVAGQTKNAQYPGAIYAIKTPDSAAISFVPNYFTLL